MARRKLHDRYFRQAKEEGFAARSAYKLQQIQEAKRIIRAGNAVLDLGCAPGSWLQVASELVGPEGRVVGIDLNPVQIHVPDNVRAITGDINDVDPATLIDLAEGPFDVVISDMAPKTIGHGDAERSITLCNQVLDLIPHLLKPTGNLTMKVFEGSGYTELLARTKKMFTEARGYKPQASRDVSREMYIVAKRYVPGSGGMPSAPRRRHGEA